MPSDYENGLKKIIDLSVQTEKMTSGILKSAVQEFLSGSAEKSGQMTLKQLEKKSGGKLDSIEVSESNIADFTDTAKKYDVDFALKKDKSTEPPTYHVFFSAAKSENFTKAFAEYAGVAQDKLQNRKRGEMSREQVKQEAQKINEQPKRKEKEREKSRESVR